MPVLGLGTWKAPVGAVGKAVEYALTQAGYRHIDCATIYLNEEEIGAAFLRAFTSGKVKREDVFVTSKLWNDAHGKNEVALACKKTLQDLQLDYLDLYLMHWGLATPSDVVGEHSNHRGEPLDENGFLLTKSISIRETWEAMEELVAQGLARAVGVANFTGPMLLDLLTYAKKPPAMNQVELHPYNAQSRLVEFCKYKGIAVTAYSPLGSPGNTKAKGHPVLLEDPQVLRVAQKYKRTTAQVLIRWAIQRGTVVIPKSVTPERIRENISALEFELAPEDMQTLNSLDRQHRYVEPYEWWRIPYFE
ncbi:aldo/keto reductase [Candidatus Uhrbacteria bacterium]|nr:aldo/keto reductase [Candidatus Uhrbacteria bacterium]